MSKVDFEITAGFDKRSFAEDTMAYSGVSKEQLFAHGTVTSRT